MKTKNILFLILMLLFGIILSGCKKEELNILPDTIIVKELPIMRIGYIKLEEPKVIQTQAKLDEFDHKNSFHHVDDLKNIDFSQHTLLLGFTGFGTQVSKIQHSFTKTIDSRYCYSLYVFLTGCTSPDSFMYGIIVKKIPDDATVAFKVEVDQL